MNNPGSFAKEFSRVKASEHYETINSIGKYDNPAAANQPSTSYNQPSTSHNQPSTSSIKQSPVKSGNSNSVLVNPKQRGNPLIKSIINVPWEYSDNIVPDYVMGRTTCALFLSLRYHILKPDYIYNRVKSLGKLYELRVLVLQIDVKEPHNALKQLTRMCLVADLTLMLSWSSEEAGKLIETYKIFENKPPDLIMSKTEGDDYSRLANALTTIRAVNKTDAALLLSTFGSLENICNATLKALTLCPGFAQHKATQLYNTLHKPFLKSNTKEN
ncbi:Restriction endonuclease type II-like,RuvA domain 2-like,ERCC1/RAD10/SWI10 family [Cinara cedri]|uniref:DNA excision repair protein ERCC-1 n=1 Tax=Cinara cedri TaxID=506608 RepID=A0A5E4MMZ2_9HEMI|nr:Restriction endonuclease type II-like,RuvA domain 2-like,ERCC1/RAD10/SWI10 family [Cinara cedri]